MADTASARTAPKHADGWPMLKSGARLQMRGELLIRQRQESGTHGTTGTTKKQGLNRSGATGPRSAGSVMAHKLCNVNCALYTVQCARGR